MTTMTKKDRLLLVIDEFQKYCLDILKNKPKELEIKKWIESLSTKHNNSISTFIGWIIKDIRPVVDNRGKCLLLLINQSGINNSANFTVDEYNKIYDYIKRICDFLK